MVSSVELIEGPLVTEMSRQKAENGLRQLVSKRESKVAYAMEQIAGRWVAALVEEDDEDEEKKDETKESATKQSGPPPFGGGAPADDDEESAGPKSEGPDDKEPSEGDGDSDDDGGAAPPKAPKPEKGEAGKGGELHKILQMLETLFTALGLPNDVGEPPEAGPGTPPPPPPHAPGPPGPASPPGVKPNEQHVIHERVTKPGETPPGGTPVGAPAFASVRDDHPWAKIAGRTASFEVFAELGNRTLEEALPDLQALAREIGYRVGRLREARGEQGQRVAVAVITKHEE
jgi:hypothetical protein